MEIQDNEEIAAILEATQTAQGKGAKAQMGASISCTHIIDTTCIIIYIYVYL